jgi:hypothetical protein
MLSFYYREAAQAVATGFRTSRDQESARHKPSRFANSSMVSALRLLRTQLGEAQTRLAGAPPIT